MMTEDEAAPRFAAEVVSIGGRGRAGLPRGMALASRGSSVRRSGLDASASGPVNPETKGGRL